MEWNDRIRTIKAMNAFGGSFVQALAAAWRCADSDNSAKIEAAWPEYIEKYRKLSETMPEDA